MNESSIPPAEGASRKLALRRWIRALDYTKPVYASPPVLLAGLLDALAEQHRDRPALLGEGQSLSYAELAARANQYSRWAIAQGLAAGDVVSLLMPNCPDYVAIWMGLTRAGCAVALINTNLISDALLHCIECAGSHHLIVGAVLAQAVTAIAERLPADSRVCIHGQSNGGFWPQIEHELASLDASPLSVQERPLPEAQDRALLIYTSGTTGLPKAANITHRRVAEWSFWFAGMMDAGPNDRLYNCLPMYHSIGGIVAVGAMLVKGGSVFIRARFSASRFWDDVVESSCTIFQYIGELCRYLLQSPTHLREREHRLRLACGNGLSAAVWERFQERFGIPHILEYYAATEGMVSLYNAEEKPGAIGRIPPFLSPRFPVVLVRSDPDSGEPIRGQSGQDGSGFCTVCGPDEPGEAISPAQNFDGYTDGRASARKLLDNVFTHGDRWYRTGDLLRKDAAGYFYFVDRIGDTFRWRGENVSTTQVADVLRACPGVTDAVVYGVLVPGNEGRAGMATITTDDCFDFSALHLHLSTHLPAYAQPLFVRQCDNLDLTGTFKLTKGHLVREGFAQSSDPVWFNDHTAGQFVAVDEALLQAINTAARRL